MKLNKEISDEWNFIFYNLYEMNQHNWEKWTKTYPPLPLSSKNLYANGRRGQKDVAYSEQQHYILHCTL